MRIKWLRAKAKGSQSEKQFSETNGAPYRGRGGEGGEDFAASALIITRRYPTGSR